ncbi:MAG: hypothetical protein BYD32DRAFT_462013 [Podila humilis]|nr:MAG: hypothetical protein BYD32DRAFT_462013 [Podila humilis]
MANPAFTTAAAQGSRTTTYVDQGNNFDEYLTLKARLEVPMDQWEPFAIRKLRMPNEFDDDYLSFLHNCPKLEDTSINILEGSESEAPKILAACCPMLRRLNLATVGYARKYLDASQQTLEFMGLQQRVSAQEVVSLLKTIVQDWDLLQTYRPIGTIEEWWDH